jgi:ABC-2 type transport system permease protein
MNPKLRAFLGGMNAELHRLKRSRLLIALVLLQAITFLVLVSLFGMTGAFAPTALVNNDNGPLSQAFINNLENDHHSFNLIFMNNETAAKELVTKGSLIAMIVIPQGFSENISQGKTVQVTVLIDNIDTDLTDDIQRAVPSAIMSFGDQSNFGGVSSSVVESDSYAHDTSFINYMVASALVLDALIISGTLSAFTVAEEFESKTSKVLAVSPIHPLIPMVGRVAATTLVSAVALSITALVGLIGYGISPVYPLQMALTLALCIIMFSCIGAALGAVMKKTLPVALFILGIALPLYLFSGSYEPQRFDGNLIWAAAHFSPEYYAVGLMEHAIFSLKITPEPLAMLALALIGWIIVSLALAWFFSRRGFS